MKNYFWLLIISVLLFSATAVAQEPAVFTCVQVNQDGSATLWFKAPPDAADVEQYLIYFSLNGGVFLKIDSIAGGADGNISYTHANALANSGSRYYYIETVYNTNSFSSLTLQSVYLQLDNNAPDFNQADLFWNAVSTPLPEGSSSYYNIYWDFPAGIWNLVDSVADTDRFSMPVIVCDDSINFKIEIKNVNACSSVSNIRGARFKNMDEPDIPLIDSISVDGNEHIVIGWDPVPSAAAYIIYRWESIWKPIDTVIGVNNTFYTDTVPNACKENIAYSVATIDTCGSSGPKDENKQRRNIRIDTLRFNTCDASISLNWTKYRFPAPEVYEIWFSEDGGAFQKAGEAPASDSVFTHSNVSNGVSYVYYVHCKFTSGSSTTCRKSIQTYEYIEPQFVYLANADVLPSQEVELTAEIDLDVIAGAWEIFRLDPGASTALKIATVDRTEVNANPLVYVDQDADPSTGSYSYFIKVLDSCSFEKLESNTLKAIHLTGEIVDDKTNDLRWTAFEGWDAAVEKYYIFRMMGEQEPTAPIDSVDAQTFNYTDDYSSLGNVDGRFVYWVQAVERNGNGYAYKAKARSNRLQLFLESRVYFANAFKPGGVNSVFKPVFRFFSGTAYTFHIYNRWGQLIFESADPEEGWSGEYKGNHAARGVYIYHLSYIDVYGKSIVLRGTVVLLQ